MPALAQGSGEISALKGFRSSLPDPATGTHYPAGHVEGLTNHE